MLRAPLVMYALVFVAGCKGEAAKQAEIEMIKEKARTEQRILDEQKAVRERQSAAAAEQKAKMEQAAKEAALRQEMLSTPGNFLKVTDTESFNKGILESYRQLVKMSVTNKSKYPVEGLTGQVEWLDDGGEIREVTRFRLKGTLTGGDTKVYRVADGTMESTTTESHAHKLNVKFVTAKFVETVGD